MMRTSESRLKAGNESRHRFAMNGSDTARLIDRLEFRSSGIHGQGVFARHFIPAGTRVLEYLGQRINKAESLRRCEADNRYIFTLDEDHDLDGDVGWNPAKFINHACVPNCEAELIDGRIWIVARRDIHPGEELAFNYGYDLEAYEEHPCRCGAAECVGFIVAEEYFETIKARTPRLV